MTTAAAIAMMVIVSLLPLLQLPSRYEWKPEAQVASVQSAARSPVQDVQEPVSTEAIDEKS
jgi:hypothetical protein